MNISVEKVASSERTNLEKLLQLYLHDLSLYFPITFDSKVCEYEYDLQKAVLFANFASIFLFEMSFEERRHSNRSK